MFIIETNSFFLSNKFWYILLLILSSNSADLEENRSEFSMFYKVYSLVTLFKVSFI